VVGQCKKRGVNRITALLFVITLWAGIFLPGLGSTELKGEEGRRIMPAVTMLEGGSWVVPYVGGKPFLRKPPLVQWCMAASMKIMGRSVWAVRLPSVLSVLALAVVMVLCTRGWLIAEQSLIAAIIMMVQVATVEKCRLAELEAIYVSLSGIALVLWMSWWTQGRSPWLVWTVPWVFNGLALLAKAPLHLVFFYAIVVCVLIASREVRRLWSVPHMVGLLIMAAIVAVWAVPYFREVSTDAAGQVWKRQFIERVTGAEMDWVKWLLNIPNGLSNHLPWVLFVPLLWRKESVMGLHPKSASLLRGGRWGVALCFVVALLIPGVLPRYVQPLVAPFSLLLALVIWECPEVYRKWWRYGLMALTAIVFLASMACPFIVGIAISHGASALNPGLAAFVILVVFACALLLMALRQFLHETLHLSLWTASVAALVMLLFSIMAVPWMRLKEDIRPFAQRIDAAMPPGETLVAYGLDDFAPLLATLFYLRTPFAYAPNADASPEGEHTYLIRGKDLAKFEDKFRMIGEPIAIWDAKEDKKPTIVVRAQKLLEKKAVN
jgi:4-amino-4-deoxy-L-arabinose transferase-like glycosyltransferase